MADPNKIAQVLEQYEVPPDVVEEVFQELSSPTKQPVTQVAESDDSIRLRLMDEKDWRKRAALHAMLISRSLE